jgi:hypothetical protein
MISSAIFDEAPDPAHKAEEHEKDRELLVPEPAQKAPDMTE